MHASRRHKQIAMEMQWLHDQNESFFGAERSKSALSIFLDHIVTSAPYWTTVSAASLSASRPERYSDASFGVVFFGGKGCSCTRPLVSFFAA